MIHILYTFFNERLDKEVFDTLLGKIPYAMRDRIGKFHRWQDAHCGLFGKLLLIEGLKKYGIQYTALEEMQYTEFNRPYLEREVDFNLSHAGNGVICAITDIGDIGVDIEEVIPINPDYYTNQFTMQELTTIRKAKDSDAEFYHWWTKKEAIIKADGMGLSLPLKEIIFKNPGIAEINNRRWEIRKIPLSEAHYCCHMAYEGKAETPFSIEQYTFGG